MGKYAYYIEMIAIILRGASGLSRINVRGPMSRLEQDYLNSTQLSERIMSRKNKTLYLFSIRSWLRYDIPLHWQMPEDVNSDQVKLVEEKQEQVVDLDLSQTLHAQGHLKKNSINDERYEICLHTTVQTPDLCYQLNMLLWWPSRALVNTCCIIVNHQVSWLSLVFGSLRSSDSPDLAGTVNVVAVFEVQALIK
jgi:hypothetical protein